MELNSGRDAIALAILSALAASSRHELSLDDLRAATEATRARYGGPHRFQAALAMLARRDLIWLLDQQRGRDNHVGLTQRAIDLLVAGDPEGVFGGSP